MAPVSGPGSPEEPSGTRDDTGSGQNLINGVTALAEIWRTLCLANLLKVKTMSAMLLLSKTLYFFISLACNIHSDYW